MCLFISLKDYYQWRNTTKKFNAVANGKILSIERKSPNLGSETYVEYNYFVSGKVYWKYEKYSVNLNTRDDIEVGDTIKVLYNPQNVTEVSAIKKSDFFLGITISLFSTLLVLYFIVKEIKVKKDNF
jgi:hypothetical protein